MEEGWAEPTDPADTGLARILARAKAIKPVAFSLDEAREIAIKSEAETKAKAPLTSAKTIEAQKKAELLAKA